jgi:hypothetical protein
MEPGFVSSSNSLGLIDANVPYDNIVLGTGDTEAEKPASPLSEASARNLSYEQADEFLDAVLLPLYREQMAQQGTMVPPIAGDESAIFTFPNPTPVQCHEPDKFVPVLHETLLEVAATVRKLQSLLTVLLPDNAKGLYDHPVLTTTSSMTPSPTLISARTSSPPFIHPLRTRSLPPHLESGKTSMQPMMKTKALSSEAASATRQIPSMLNSPPNFSSPSGSQPTYTSIPLQNTLASLSAARGRNATAMEEDYTETALVSTPPSSIEPLDSCQQSVRASTEELFNSDQLQLLYPLETSPPLSLVALPDGDCAMFDTHLDVTLDVKKEDEHAVLIDTPDAQTDLVGVSAVPKLPKLENDTTGQFVNPIAKLAAMPQEVSSLDNDPTHPPFHAFDNSPLCSNRTCKIGSEMASYRDIATLETASAPEYACDPQTVALGAHVITLGTTNSATVTTSIAGIESTSGALRANDRSSPEAANRSGDKRMEMGHSLVERLSETDHAIASPLRSSPRPLKDRISSSPSITPLSSPENSGGRYSHGDSPRKRSGHHETLDYSRPVRRRRVTEESSSNTSGVGKTPSLLSRIGPAL